MAEFIDDKDKILEAYKKTVLNEGSVWDDIWGDDGEGSYEEEEEDLFDDSPEDPDREYSDEEKAARLARMDSEEDLELGTGVSDADVDSEPAEGQTLVTVNGKAVLVDPNIEDLDSTVEDVLERLDVVDLSDEDYSNLRDKLQRRSVDRIDLSGNSEELEESKKPKYTLSYTERGSTQVEGGTDYSYVRRSAEYDNLEDAKEDFDSLSEDDEVSNLTKSWK
jgi:hypothetical protein